MFGVSPADIPIQEYVKLRLNAVKLCLGIVGGLVAIFVAYVGYRRNSVMEKGHEITKSAQLDERFVKACEMLTSVSESVISGGIYVLRGVALEFPEKYMIIVINVLEDYLRALIAKQDFLLREEEDSYSGWGAYEEEINESLTDALMADKLKNLPSFTPSLLKVLKNLKEIAISSGFSTDSHINLKNMDFSYFYLKDYEFSLCDFTGAKFSFVNLDSAYFLDCISHPAFRIENCSLNRTTFSRLSTQYFSITKSLGDKLVLNKITSATLDLSESVLQEMRLLDSSVQLKTTVKQVEMPASEINNFETQIFNIEEGSDISGSIFSKYEKISKLTLRDDVKLFYCSLPLDISNRVQLEKKHFSQAAPLNYSLSDEHAQKFEGLMLKQLDSEEEFEKRYSHLSDT